MVLSCTSDGAITIENDRPGGGSGGNSGRQAPVEVRGIQKANDNDGCPDDRIVLLGNSRRLDQPIQGVHPPGVDVPALGHLLGESSTVDPSRGVFLDHTWRMHPDICALTTE